MTEHAGDRSPAKVRPLRWVMRALAVSVPVGLLALLAYGVTARSPYTSIDDNLSRGNAQAAPAFSLHTLQAGSLGGLLGSRLQGVFAGGMVTPARLRGTPIVLNFWASWCVPCQEEASTLQRAWRQQARPRGVLFLGLDMQDVTGDARSFIRHYAIDYPNIRDPSNDVARSYGVTGVPETFYISASGKIVGHIIGVSSTAQLKAGIDAAASGQVEGSRRGGPQGNLK